MELHLTGKVSRRLFLLFLVAALLPMSGMAWYAYKEVSGLLIDTADQQLREQSKSFGMSLIEALNSRADELKQNADSPLLFQTLSAHPNFLSARRTPIPPDLTEAQRKQLERGRVTIRIAQGSPTELFMLQPGTDAVIAAELNPDPLWKNDASPERYCVLDAAFAPLFCTQGLTPPDKTTMKSRLGNGNGAVMTMNIGGEDFLLGFWRPQFLPSLGSDGFVIMQATPKAIALASLSRFQHLFPAIVILAFALAAGLAVNQIRRQMQPLGKLAEGTRKLAEGEFGTRVTLQSNDEFADLGKAFNVMAENLEYKFHMLDMLGALDRAILSASQIEYVEQEMLKHIGQAIPCDGAGIVDLDDLSGHGLLSYKPDQGAVYTPLPVPPPGLPDPEAFKTSGSVALATPLPLWLRLLSSLPLNQALAFPITVDGKIKQILLLAYVEMPDNQESAILSGRALADRLAIAHASFTQSEKLYHQAHYDGLTDLPNRVLLRDRVEQALIRAQRNQTAVALILIDLDDFKRVNDTLGHASGDLLLIKFAMRLKLRIRQGDTLARLGGDEFVVLLQDLARGDEYTILESMLRDLTETLSKPVELGNHQITTLASIGVALYPENATHFDELLKMADVAMYESKRTRPGHFRFYSHDINAQIQSRFELTQELRAAIDNDELTLYYQPKITAGTGRIAGAEALIRWQSPKRGLLAPGIFIHLFEEMGLSGWLSQWLLAKACGQMRAWDEAGFEPIPVSVNISPSQFEHGSIQALVEESLARHRLEPARLEIEVLEETAVSSSVSVRDELQRLRALGVNIALDDFGTGYSSLVYLTRIPANVLKLDRVFIQTLPYDLRQQEIVKHIIGLAKVLDYEIVAEGVENEAQLDLLVEMGCDHIQGYFYSRPIPPEVLAEQWLAKGSPAPSDAPT